MGFSPIIFPSVFFLGVEPTRLERGCFIATTPRELVTSSGIGPAAWQCRWDGIAAFQPKIGGINFEAWEVHWVFLYLDVWYLEDHPI